MHEYNHIEIEGWMYHIGCDNLKELIAYAIIFGFSHDGESKFYGSLKYVMKALKCSKHTAIDTLKALENKGLIKKEQVTMQGVTFNKYSAILQVVKNLYTQCKNCTTGEDSAPNNKDNIVSSKEETSINNNPSILLNKENISSKETSKERNFRKPTLEEVTAYCAERKNGIDPQRFIDYYESNGWMVGRTHMKDWKAAVRTWEAKEKQQKQIAYGNIDRNDGAASPAPRKRDYNI